MFSKFDSSKSLDKIIKNVKFNKDIIWLKKNN